MDLKSRLRNKTFLTSMVAMLLVLANQVASLFGYDISFINQKVTDLAETIFVVLGLLGVIIAPNTDGIKD